MEKAFLRFLLCRRRRNIKADFFSCVELAEPIVDNVCHFDEPFVHERQQLRWRVRLTNIHLRRQSVQLSNQTMDAISLQDLERKTYSAAAEWTCAIHRRFVILG